MFGLEYAIALIKIMYNVAFSIITAIPFHLAWNKVVPLYFTDIVPSTFHAIPYWHCVCMLLICTFVGEMVEKLTPKLVSVNVNNSVTNKRK